MTEDELKAEIREIIMTRLNVAGPGVSEAIKLSIARSSAEHIVRLPRLRAFLKKEEGG